jgi:serine protease Do
MGDKLPIVRAVSLNLSRGLTRKQTRVFLVASLRNPLGQFLRRARPLAKQTLGGPSFNARALLFHSRPTRREPSPDNPGTVRIYLTDYTVPINTAKEFLPQMIGGQTVVHALLGIYSQTLTPGLAKTLGLSQTSGVYALQVDPGSPAAAAGVVGSEQSNSDLAVISPGGDVIIGVDDKQVTSSDEMDDYIDSKQPGDTVSLHVVRGGKEIAISATLAEWPNPS